MKLDTEKLKPWLNEFWDNPPNCICKNEDWVVLEGIWELTEYHPNFMWEPTIPIVVFMCHNCSHIISFSAIALELVKKQEVGNLT